MSSTFEIALWLLLNLALAAGWFYAGMYFERNGKRCDD